MQDAPDPNENTEAAEYEQSSTALAPVAANSASAVESTEPSTVLAEVLPGIAVVFGNVPPELESSAPSMRAFQRAAFDALATGLGVPAGDRPR